MNREKPSPGDAEGLETPPVRPILRQETLRGAAFCARVNVLRFFEAGGCSGPIAASGLLRTIPWASCLRKQLLQCNFHVRAGPIQLATLFDKVSK